MFLRSNYQLFYRVGNDYLMDISKAVKENTDGTYNISLYGKVYKKSISPRPIGKNLSCNYFPSWVI